MSEQIQGNCKCGAFTYTSVSEMFGSHYCHCRDCQVFHGGPFGAGFAVIESETKLCGSLAEYEVVSESGNTRKHLFCPDCGTPVGERIDVHPGVLVLCAGTLADSSHFKPEMHLWVSSKVPWLEITDELPQHAKQPDFEFGN